MPRPTPPLHVLVLSAGELAWHQLLAWVAALDATPCLPAHCLSTGWLAGRLAGRLEWVDAALHAPRLEQHTACMHHPTRRLCSARLGAAVPQAPPCSGSCMEPSTPTEGCSSLPRWVHCSGSSEEAEAAGSAEGSKAAPLLAAGTATGARAGPSGAGLRQRPGQHRAQA